jgi:hypothetical protein
VIGTTLSDKKSSSKKKDKKNMNSYELEQANESEAWSSIAHQGVAKDEDDDAKNEDKKKSAEESDEEKEEKEK